MKKNYNEKNAKSKKFITWALRNKNRYSQAAGYESCGVEVEKKCPYTGNKKVYRQRCKQYLLCLDCSNIRAMKKAREILQKILISQKSQKTVSQTGIGGIKAKIKDLIHEVQEPQLPKTLTKYKIGLRRELRKIRQELNSLWEDQ